MILEERNALVIPDREFINGSPYFFFIIVNGILDAG